MQKFAHESRRKLCVALVGEHNTLVAVFIECAIIISPVHLTDVGYFLDGQMERLSKGCYFRGCVRLKGDEFTFVV